ncbi:hypothetical protein [Engelhardtia mirabilis]|uniref:Uncharacterized protein n=1 Tax=Engelhardtia mirabilis TaxID=2528011 RepID=A0A518BKF2_9BACT|nr:hypothetical protein Pla133_25370 [Planctomycetes bacterium Pla133]QDV01780.1 hypothetical protein Pla86_25360 [Planctomycetes bacterium Pla86]
MNQTKQFVIWGAAAIVLGVVLAMIVPGREGAGDSALPQTRSKETSEQRKERLRAPRDAKEDTAAADFLDKRWGHMGDTGAVTAHVDPFGTRYYVEKKIFVGRGHGGVPIYAKAYSTPSRIHPDAIKLKSPDDAQGARVTLENWEPGELAQRMASVKHANNPEDLPENLQHLHPKHPDYTGL